MKAIFYKFSIFVMRKIEKMIVRMISCFMIISSIIPVSVNAETKTITSISAPNPSSVNIKKGVAAAALNLPSTLKVVLSDDTTETPAVTWSSDTYNPSAVGDYVFYATLPEGYYALNDGVTLPTLTVTVTDGNRYQITNNPDNPLLSGIEVLDTGADPQKTYWAYCVDDRSIWPTDDTYFGSVNTSENLPQDIADKALQLTRIMYAGSPTYALGLSALLNTNNPLTYGNYTQHAIWTITNPADYDPVRSGNLYPYIKALYEYATTGTLTGEFAKYMDNIKPAAVTADKS
ncbi:MAG: Cys-Gln thioester bond-forming surface protein, partial [Clostridiales bacterium]|nr:Cys-Gln thioester bond-forming surface protein [Clostridiales bacterium]